MAIGQDLLDLPFAEMVRNLAFAIAEGQLALDRSSIETLQFLLNHNVEIVPEITEVIEPVGHDVTIGPTGGTLTITGARPSGIPAPTITLNLLQAGITPTFYQFTEAQIEVKLSITMRRVEETTTSSKPFTPYVALAGLPHRAFASSVDYRTANTYSYSAEGASVFRATIRPVPPPSRITPTVTTINTLTKPPTITTQ